MRIGRYYVNLIFRLGSFWIGAHYSKRNRCVCFAPVFCVVVRVGLTPYVKDPDLFEREDLHISEMAIKGENEQLTRFKYPRYTLVVDDHGWHIRQHLRMLVFPWAWGFVVVHVAEHIYMWYVQKRSGLQPIYTEEVVANLRSNRERL